MKANTSAEITLLDGVLFLTDYGHELPNAPLTPEQENSGFVATEHAAMFMTGYEFCLCKLEVRRSKPSIPARCQRSASFLIRVESGQCCLGDHIVPGDSTIAVDLHPGDYMVTLVQELVSDKIEVVGNTAAIKVTVFFENLRFRHFR